MSFYEPSQLIFLWLIPLALLVFGWGRAERKRRLNRLGHTAFLEARLMPGFSPARRRWTGGLLVGVLLLSILALARPQWGEEKKKIERKGVDLVFLFDTSLSMLAEDVKPSRIGKSKLEIKNIIRRLKGDRLGMVAFAGSSFLQCPLTLDYSAFLLFVDALKVGYIPNPGTSLNRALELALRAFPPESRKYRGILIFSDGEDHEGGIDQALAAAKKSGVRVYTIGTGTVEGEPIPLREGGVGKISGYKKDRQGQVVVTRLNPDLLEKIARETGGLYLAATAGEREVDVILRHLESLGERKLKERLVVEREDHFQFFLLLALLLLVGESLWSERRGKRAGSAVLPLLALFLFCGFLDTSRSLVQKGNKNVQEKKYQSAVENYRKAEVTSPENPVVRYNLGTALYHLYEYRDAEKELEQALSRARDRSERAHILYNYGNTQYRLGDFEKAIDAYKKVLDLNPKDPDAKYNLEFLKKKKSEFEKKQQDRQNQQQNQPQQNQQQQQSQSPSQSQQQQNQPEQGGRENQQDQPQPQQGQEQQSESGQAEEGQSGQAKDSNQDQQPQERQSEEQQRGTASPKPQGEEKQEEGQEQNEEKQQDQQKQEESQSSEGQQPQKQPLQGQMSTESALRILEALRGSEKELQDLRRPRTPSDASEPEKDW